MNSKISELDLVSVVDQNDVLPIVNDGITKKVKVSQLKQDLQSVTDKGATTTNEIEIVLDSLNYNTALKVEANGVAVRGKSTDQPGIYGISTNSRGIEGYSTNGTAIQGYSQNKLGGDFQSFSGPKIVSFSSNNTEQSYILNNGLFKSNRILINTTTDNGIDRLQVNGSVIATQYKVSALNTAPATATATGTLGEIRYTSDFIYVCIATNTWRRTALTSW